MNKIVILSLQLVIFFCELFLCQSNNWKIINDNDFPIKYVSAVAVDSMNNIWLSSDSGIVKYDHHAWRVMKKTYANCISVDKFNTIWIGTLGEGLFRFDGTTWEQFNTLNSELPSDQVTSVAFDSKNNIWIGTSSGYGIGGLAKLSGSNWEIFNDQNTPLPVNSILSVAADCDGTIWLGLECILFDRIKSISKPDVILGGLVSYNGNDWEIFTPDNCGIPDYQINSITIEDCHCKWIGTGNGLAAWEDSIWTIFDIFNSPLTDNQINSIVIDKRNNKWIGTGNNQKEGSVLYYDVGEWHIFNSSNSELPSGYIKSIAVDRFNNKWIGIFPNGNTPHDWVGGGLAVFNENGIVEVKKEEYQPVNFCLSQNYPNPFNPATTIKYSIPFVETRRGVSLQYVTLKIFDLLGREVATLVNEEKPAGSYEVLFNASNLSSGVYFYQLKAGEFVQTKKMILLR